MLWIAIIALVIVGFQIFRITAIELVFFVRCPYIIYKFFFFFFFWERTSYIDMNHTFFNIVTTKTTKFCTLKKSEKWRVEKDSSFLFVFSALIMFWWVKKIIKIVYINAWRCIISRPSKVTDQHIQLQPSKVLNSHQDKERYNQGNNHPNLCITTTLVTYKRNNLSH